MNTIEGDTRLSGLARIIADGGVVAFAARYVKWPGRANVEVNLVVCAKSRGVSHSVLDDKQVTFISSRLDEEPEIEAASLRQSQGFAFQGDVLRGNGFVLEEAEAHTLLAHNPGNQN